METKSLSIHEKLEILAASARWDVSCSSSGSSRPNEGGLGNAYTPGICHSWGADGRCISLLKVLMTNYCMFDCAYCANRRSNAIPRAKFTPRELVDLTLGFYRRNYIEGLFLSSGVWKSPNATMEDMLEIVRLLRTEGNFQGYIHLKAIPGADPNLIHAAGLYADRMSVNLELPSQTSLAKLAPDKNPKNIFAPMSQINNTMKSTIKEKILLDPINRIKVLPRPQAALYAPKTELIAFNENKATSDTFVPAGQTTQLIVGASPERDQEILKLSESLYGRFSLKRVYFSAYVPVNNDSRLPTVAQPPLLREHRLYQADWLLRFYQFKADEILDDLNPDLDTQVDPKTAWALRHPEKFPIDLATASWEDLLRIPGLGPKSVRRIWQTRKVSSLSWETLKAMKVVLKRVSLFALIRGKKAPESFRKESTTTLPFWDGTNNSALLIRYGLTDPAVKKLTSETQNPWQGELFE